MEPTTTKMDPEVKRKWIEALESGKYEQGKYHLRDSQNNYCCLGVLCDTLDPSQWFQSEKRWLYLDNDATIPQSIKKQIGLFMDATNNLITLNDRESRSFTEIAQWIKENL